jgi:hypothetical protein
MLIFTSIHYGNWSAKVTRLLDNFISVQISILHNKNISVFLIIKKCQTIKTDIHVGRILG